MKNVSKVYSIFNKEVNDDILQVYLRKIAQIPLLSKEEELNLIKLAQDGDAIARNKIIESNLKLVLNIAKKSIHNSKLPLIDLIQEGNLGLVVAIDKFDCKLGYKFSTYATWWIRQAMFKAISEQSSVMKIPVYIQETLSKYKKIKSDLEKECGHEVKNSVVAEKMNLSEDKIDTYLNAFTFSLSLETHYEEEGEKNLSLSEIIEDKKSDVLKPVIDLELKRDILSVLNLLKLKEQDVLKRRFGLNDDKAQTLLEIGQSYGVTKECIRQIEKKAIKKLHDNLDVQELLFSYAV